jgi:hypothetical protein
MRTGTQISMAALMLLVVLAALELALFQEIWFIVLFPPVTMAVLALNLGFFFLMVRPKFLMTRIMGILLACVATSLGMSILGGLSSSRPERSGVFGKAMRDAFTSWANSLPDPQSATATFLRFSIWHSIALEFIMLDVLGVAMVWAGGWLENRWRVHWARARTPADVAAAPLDGRAASPL